MSSHGVVIVGGGIAAVSLVAALRSGGFADPITMIDRAELPYDRPPLSKDYLAGRRTLGDLALQAAEWYAEQRVQLIGGAEVVALRPDPGEVELSDGRVITGDRIVVATGGDAVRPPIPGADSSRVHVLRDVQDADALRKDLAPGARLLVVGAGLIGAEAASTAHELGCDVVLVDPVDPPAVHAFGRVLATWLHRQHTDHGITTRCATVTRIDQSGPRLQVMLTDDDEPVEVDAVLLGIGMRPRTALAEAAGLAVDGGVLVDDRQVTSHPRVLAIGDVARLRGEPRPEHWEAAQLDGRRAAATILGAEPATVGASWFWSDRHGHHAEGIGNLDPVGDHEVVVRGVPGEGPFSVFVVAGGRVVGAAAVDDSRAVRAARRLVDRAVVADPVRLADPATDLRQLLRG